MRTTPLPPRPSSVAAAVLAISLIVAGCSDSSGTAADEPTEAAAAEESTEESTDQSAENSALDSDVAAVDGVALFDADAVHDIELTFDQSDYDAMIETLASTGEKEWIEVTVTIDGVTYENAGARLKGNSSLAGLSATGPGGGRGGGAGGSADADDPASLPWLIRLDEFVEDQDHQGYVDIVIRSNNSESSLNEAVALDLLAEAGLATQDAAHTRFTVNGSETALRLMIEHPSDDEWQDTNFDGSGALYKAESSGDWSYRGEDQDAYDEVFDQEGGKKVTDLEPLIEFLDFVNNSDDETFAAELSDHLDVEAFATYLAMMELVDNFDDIDGPGNNAYLWWDEASDRFTVVPWDLNLAFGGLAGGPGGGGGGGGGFGGRPEAGGELPEGIEPPTDGELPEGFQPGGGGEFPEGFEPPTDGELPEGFQPGGGGGGGFGGGSNPLVDRFLAVDEFSALYETALAELDAELFDSGLAADILAERSSVLADQASDLIDDDTLASETDAIAEALA